MLDAYNDVKSAMKYGRDALTDDVVNNAIKTKEFELKESKNDGEPLFVRRKSSNKNHDRSGKSGSKSGVRVKGVTIVIRKVILGESVQ